MKYKWLNRESNQKIIIFFNGWGMDEKAVKHLDCEDFDIVMFYDYKDLNTDFDFDLKYDEKYLISWSMGVKTATLFCKNMKSSTAINGTLKPIDPIYGINPKIYDLTIKNFNEDSKNKFVNSMFENSAINHMDLIRNDSPEALREELIAIKNYKANEEFKYSKVFISKNDKIIPAKNQCRYWNIEPNFKGGHFPFFEIEKWSELL